MDASNPDDLLSRRTDHLKIVKPADGTHVESEPRLFLNRELSWLAFNERVLEEARDPSFPHLRNRSLNIAVILSKSQGRRRTRTKTPKEQLLAVVQVPMVLGRLVRLPSEPGKQAFALLGDVISAYVGDLFPGYEVRQTAR